MNGRNAASGAPNIQYSIRASNRRHAYRYCISHRSVQGPRMDGREENAAADSRIVRLRFPGWRTIRLFLVRPDFRTKEKHTSSRHGQVCAHCAIQRISDGDGLTSTMPHHLSAQQEVKDPESVCLDSYRTTKRRLLLAPLTSAPRYQRTAKNPPIYCVAVRESALPLILYSQLLLNVYCQQKGKLWA